jgi:hypothetical protein
LFDLFAGPHWTLLGYESHQCPLEPRNNLHIHGIGGRGDLTDYEGQFLSAYSPTPGDIFLIRPDGYIGAILGAGKIGRIDRYLADVGVG